MVIERAETPVMFKRVADEASAISHAMQDVQERRLRGGSTTVGTPRSRGRSPACIALATVFDASTDSASRRMRPSFGSSSMRCMAASTRKERGFVELYIGNGVWQTVHRRSVGD